MPGFFRQFLNSLWNRQDAKILAVSRRKNQFCPNSC